MSDSTLRLVWLPANQAYMFIFGQTPLRMGDGPMFFENVDQARWAAKKQGLMILAGSNVVTGKDRSHVEDATDYGTPEVLPC